MRIIFIFLAFVACTSNKEAVETNSKTIYLNLEAEPSTLNPITSTDLYATAVQDYLVGRLMWQDPDTLEWQEGIAKSYTISNDGLTYTFKIRQDAKFHDGKPVTAEDIKFSFDANFMDDYGALKLRAYFEKFESPKIIDQETIEFTAKEKYHQNLVVLATFLKILPKHVYGNPEEGKKLSQEVVGEGPYKLLRWEKGKRIILEKNPDWYGRNLDGSKDKYNFERIIFRFVRETNTALEMLKKGQLDFMDLSKDPEAFAKKTLGEEWGKSVEKHQVQIGLPKPYIFIGFNLRKPMFKDVKLRKALAHLVNREFMAESFYHNKWEVMAGPIYRHSVFADPEVKPIDFNPERALALLREAGWADSDKDGVLDKVIDGKRQPLKFNLVTGSSERLKLFTVFKEDAKKVGVDINIQVVEWNSLVQLIDERNFETIALGWGGGLREWDPKQVWHSSSAEKGGSNLVGYKNKKADALIDKARGILDEKERIPVLREFYRVVATDVPYIFMLNQKDTLYANTTRIKKPKPAFKYSLGTEYWYAE